MLELQSNSNFYCSRERAPSWNSASQVICCRRWQTFQHVFGTCRFCIASQYEPFTWRLVITSWVLRKLSMAACLAWMTARLMMGLRNHIFNKRLPIGETHLFMSPNTLKPSLLWPRPIADGWASSCSPWQRPLARKLHYMTVSIGLRRKHKAHFERVMR